MMFFYSFIQVFFMNYGTHGEKIHLCLEVIICNYLVKIN